MKEFSTEKEELESSPGGRPRSMCVVTASGRQVGERSQQMLLSDQQRDCPRKREEGRDGREASEHETTHSEWLEWPGGGLYLHRQSRCPHATHMTRESKLPMF